MFSPSYILIQETTRLTAWLVSFDRQEKSSQELGDSQELCA
jgi:hypothetical protein